MWIFSDKSKFFTASIVMIALSSGCEVNKLSPMDDELSKDVNESDSTVSKLPPKELIPSTFESSGTEVFILAQINSLENRIMNRFDKVETIDGDQVQEISQKELVSFLKDSQNMKYRLLCDENERWIYRCNRMTGEIECFSMSSNKLRLLSSTR